MATSYDDDLDLDAPRDREISLGATTILGIFLALTLVCALFFGLGFSMGRRSALSVAATATSTPATAATAPATNTPKPSPETSTHAVSTTVETTSTPMASTIPPPATATPAPTPADSQERPATAKPVAVVASQSSGGFLVQIAAVSHREDADSLLGALEQRGYQVYIRQEPQDKFLHVQIGPFPNRKDAEAMRQHLLSDGYNAIVK